VALNHFQKAISISVLLKGTPTLFFIILKVVTQTQLSVLSFFVAVLILTEAANLIAEPQGVVSGELCTVIQDTG